MDTIFSKINQGKIKQYQKHLEELKLSEATIKRRLSSIRRFCEWSYDEGYLKENPFAVPPRFPHLRGVPQVQPHLGGVRAAISSAYQIYQSISITKYLHYAILIIFCASLGFGAYDQFFRRAPEPLAYPPASALVTPNRYLSFQGRLTDSSDNPITTSTSFRFALYNDLTASGSAQLWEEQRAITPDQDGIFSVVLGTNVAISASVFTDNASIWLGVTVGNDPEMTPRQQIATVGYALNTETLQGIPPSASPSANKIPIITQSGDLVLAGASPRVYSTSGTFGIKGQALSITTDTGTNGNITLAPDGTGVLNINLGGASGNQIRVTDANITSGSLVSAYAGTNSTGFDLLNLSSGDPETEKFAVDYSGDASLAGGDITGANNVSIDIGEANSSYVISSAGLAVGGGTTYYLTNTGTLNVATINAFSLAGNMTVNQDIDIIPAGTTGTNDLGSSTYPWDNVYANNFVAPGTGISGYWQRNLGALSPANITDDLLIGGTATASAKFQVLGTGASAGTVNIVAGQGIDTLAAGTLTIGGTTQTGLTLGRSGAATSLVGSNMTAGGIGYGASNTLTFTAAGSSGQALLSGASGAPTWGTLGTTYGGTGQNWSAVTIGALPYFSGTGTMSTLAAGTSNYLLMANGAAAPSWTNAINGVSIGQTTAAAGSFTTLSSTGVTTLGNNTATVAINSSDWDIGTTGDMTGIGAITMDGNFSQTGATTFSTGTGLVSINGNLATSLIPNSTSYNLGSASNYWGAIYANNYYSPGTGVSGYWQRNLGTLAPTNITDDVLVGGTATSSALVRLPGINNQNAWFNLGTGNVGIGDVSPLSLLTVGSGDKFQVGTSGNLTINTGTSATVITAERSANGYVIETNVGGTPGVDIGTEAGVGHAVIAFKNTDILVGKSGTSGIAFGSGVGWADVPAGATDINIKGNVGIGTTTPLATLDIAGSASASGNLTFRGTGTAHLINLYDNGSLQIGNSVGGGTATPAFVVTSAGQVGIGTTSPEALLHVAATGNLIVGNAASNRVSVGANSIQIFSGDPGNLALMVRAATSQSANIFQIQNSAATGLVTVDNSGNVGIGTTSPGNPLEVVSTSNLRVIQATGALTDVGLRLDNTTAGGRGYTLFSSGTGSGIGVGNFNIYDEDAVLARLSINSSGNVGIGTTNPSGRLQVTGDEVRIGDAGTINYATDDGDLYVEDALEVDGTSYLVGLTLSGDLRLNNNQILNSAGTATIIFSSTPSTSYNTLDAGNWLVSNTANLGQAALMIDQTMGGDIFTASASGSPKVTISNAGSVGIGTTGPTSLLELYKYTSGAPVEGAILNISGLADNNDYNGIRFGYNTGASGYMKGGIFFERTGSYSVGKLHFATDNTADASNADLADARMTIDNSGNVGIGDATPTEGKLVVAGTIYATTQATGVNEAVLGGRTLTASTGLSGGGDLTTDRSFSVVYGSTAGTSAQGNITLTGPGAGTGLTGGGGTIAVGAGGTFTTINVAGGTCITANADDVAVTADCISDTQLLYNTGQHLTTSSTPQFARLGLGAAADGTYLLNLNGALVHGTSTGVGIGTTGPGSALHVYGGAPRIQIQGTTAGSNVGLQMRAVSANSTARVAGYYFVPGDTTATTFLGLSSDDSSYAMVVTNPGNVGIGTTSPGAPLHVAGGTSATGTIKGSYGIIVSSRDEWLRLNDDDGAGDYHTSGTYIDGLMVGTQGGLCVGCASNPGAGDLTVADDLRVTGEIVGQIVTYNTYGTGCGSGTACCDWLDGEPDGYDYTCREITGYGGGSVACTNATADKIVVCEVVTAGDDLAEFFPTKDDSLDKGDIVSIDPQSTEYIIKSSKGYDQTLIGIVSTDPGLVIGIDTREGYQNARAVALAGRVPTKVSSINGSINPGDPITTSSIPGVGMKATQQGPVVGKAMEGYNSSDPNAISKIVVFINPSWYNPTVFDENGNFIPGNYQAPEVVDTKPNEPGGLVYKFENVAAKQIETESLVVKNEDGIVVATIDALGKITAQASEFAEAAIANLKAGLIQTQELFANNANINELKANISELANVKTGIISPLPDSSDVTIRLGRDVKDTPLRGGFGKLLIQNQEGETVASIDEAGHVKASSIEVDSAHVVNNATISGTLYADEIVVKKGTFGELLAATVSANQIAAADLTEIQTRLAKLEDERTQIEQISTDITDPLNSSPSAESVLLAESQSWEVSDVSQDLKITSNLKVLGRTSLADTSIAGSLNVDGTLVIADSSINSLSGTLYLQNLGLGGVDILAGKVVIDIDGNVQIAGNLAVGGSLSAATLHLGGVPSATSEVTGTGSSDGESGFGKLLALVNKEGVEVASIDASGSAQFAQLTTEKIIIAANSTSEVSPSTSEVSTNATAGKATLPAGETELQITNYSITNNSLIYLTPVSGTQNKVLYVSAKKAGELFKVAIDTPVEQDIVFNWWIIN